MTIGISEMESVVTAVKEDCFHGKQTLVTEVRMFIRSC